jgi:hypothetical protein
MIFANDLSFDYTNTNSIFDGFLNCVRLMSGRFGRSPEAETIKMLTFSNVTVCLPVSVFDF